MATCTQLDLETFREYIGYNPLHFWGLTHSAVPNDSHCNTILREFSWQNADAIGRSDMKKAIAEAERKMRDYLGYPLGEVTYLETQDSPCFVHSSDVPILLTLGHGKVHRIGTDSRTFLGPVSLTLQDYDGDGVEETFVGDFGDSTTDPADVEVYFEEKERTPPSDPLCAFRIRPVSVSRYDANTIRVEGPAWVLVRPSRYTGFTSGVLDYTTAGVLSLTVDLYKHTFASANVASLILDNYGILGTYNLSAVLMDSEVGLVQVLWNDPSTPPCTCSNYSYRRYIPYNPDEPAYSEPSLRVRICYESGMDLADWKTILTRFALAELARPICACQVANKEIERWQKDLAQVSSGPINQLEGYRVDSDFLACPFGTRAGQIYAWQEVRHLRQVRSFSL